MGLHVVHVDLPVGSGHTDAERSPLETSATGLVEFCHKLREGGRRVPLHPLSCAASAFGSLLVSVVHLVTRGALAFPLSREGG